MSIPLFWELLNSTPPSAIAEIFGFPLSKISEIRKISTPSTIVEIRTYLLK
jgi:hypothetical protein